MTKNGKKITTNAEALKANPKATKHDDKKTHTHTKEAIKIIQKTIYTKS